MKCIDRLEKLKDGELDQIIIDIRRGKIKCGRYSHLIKIDKKKEMKGKEFFKDGKNSKSQ